MHNSAKDNHVAKNYMDSKIDGNGKYYDDGADNQGKL